MQANEYRILAMRTAPEGMTKSEMLTNAALGLTGESGEFADLIKKYLYQGHELDSIHLAKELGDILWYIAMAATAIEIDMESIMRLNIHKLMDRYPDGFDIERSTHRAEGDI